MIKNIIWDADGTLFDNYPAITYAFSKSMNELGSPVALNVIDGLVRKSFNQCMETLSGRFKVDPDLLRHRFDWYYRQVAPANQVPFPGAKHVCDLIWKQGGLNIAVTHHSQASTQQLLAAHGFDPLFARIVSLEQGNGRRLSPALFEAALQEFGLVGIASMVVSRWDQDIQAGSAAGLRTCLFQGAASCVPADYNIDSHDQLLALLKVP